MKPILLFLILMILTVNIPADELGYRKQTMDAVVLVDDRFSTSDLIEDWVVDAGGYLLSRLEERIVLRIPSGKLEELSRFLVSATREVVSVEQKTEDISQQVLESEAGIRSKEELFRQALGLIDDSDYTSTLQIESEILSILKDLENHKGYLALLHAESRMARVQIDYTIEEETLPQDIPSSFPWINIVDYYQLLYEFRSR